MQYYRLRVAYDGTAYHGWQEQVGTKTVIGELSRAFERVFHQPAQLLGASRTDAGVHAYDQVVRCQTVVDLDAEVLRLVWNRVLPGDVMIRSIEKMKAFFHPWHDVAYKLYWYHIFDAKPAPWYARFGWTHRYTIDTAVLRDCLNLCIGTHNFRSFCTGDRYDTTIRTIDVITVERVPYLGAMRIGIRGQKFMRYMIRRIVGSAVYAASHQAVGVAGFQRVFLAQNPEHRLPTAPAYGLTLRKIVYKNIRG